MESKGLCLDRARAGGPEVVVVAGAQRPLSHAQENFSTIKEPLINLTYVPKTAHAAYDPN